MTKQSHIISNVLTPAIKLWLRSQVEHVENLEVRIEAGDRQILTGCIEQVILAACPAVYQGLHLSEIKVSASQIRINLGQIVRGKPLRILEPIPITADLLMQADDLNASLKGPLLAGAMTEFMAKLVDMGHLLSDVAQVHEALAPESLRSLTNFQIDLNAGELSLAGDLPMTDGSTIPVMIHMGLRLIGNRELEFNDLRLHVNGVPTHSEPGLLNIDLGPDVDLQELVVEHDRLLCRGQLKINP